MWWAVSSAGIVLSECGVDENDGGVQLDGRGMMQARLACVRSGYWRLILVRIEFEDL